MNSHFLRKATILLSLSLVLSIAIGSTLSSDNLWSSPLSSLFNRADLVSEFDFAPDNVCANQAISFTDKTTGTGPFTYEWDFGDGQKSILQNPVNTFSSAVGGNSRPFTVKLTVKAADGKTATKTKVITVKEIPSLNITTSLLEQETDFEGLKYFIICENEPSEFTFVNEAGPTEKNILYQINWGDGSPPFSGAGWMELRHTYAVGIYDMTYTVTPENGCKVSKRYGVFVGSNPAVGLGNPGNTNVCVGDTLTFPITGTENNPVGTKYTVTFSDGSPVQVFSHPAPPSVSHTFTKTSCGSSADGFDNSFSVKIVARNPCAVSQASVVPIYVSEPPIPEIKIANGSFCVDIDVTIENTSQLKTEVSNSGKCNSEGKFIWEILPLTGWTLQSGSSLGSQTDPNIPASWISGNKIIKPRFTTPGTYTIKLITGNKCGLREEIKTVTVIPTPALTFSFDKVEACGETTLKAVNTSNTIGLAGVVNTWSVSYAKGKCGTTSNWAFASGSAINTESPTFIFKNPGIYTVTLNIQASCGSYKKVQEVTITAPPTIMIDAISNSCGPITISPKATVSSCDSAPLAYLWTFEGGVPATSTSLDPGPVTFSTPGQRKITLEVVSSCGTTDAEKTFIINEIPSVSAGTDTQICNGEEIKLNGTVSGGTGSFSYDWTSVPASSITDSNTATPTVKPNQTTVYKLTVSNQTIGCLSTDEVEIKVIPAPIVQFDIPNQELCSGETTQVVNITSSPLGESITWTSAASDVSGASVSGTNQIPAQTLINTTGKPIDVVFTALIASSSQGNCTVIPAEYIIRVKPEPNYVNESIEICSNEGFDYKPANLISGSTFIWSVSTPPGILGTTNSIQSATSITQQLQNTAATPLQVTYLITPSLGSCQGKPFELVVTVQPAPTITFSESDQILCDGLSSVAVAFSSDVAGTSLSWTADAKGIEGVITSGSGNELPAQLLKNKTKQPITIEYEVSGSITTGDKCTGSPTIYRITVNPSIELDDKISDFNGFGISCYGSKNGFINLNPTSGTSVFTYSWTGPDGFISNAKDLKDLSPGSYNVTVTDQFQCTISKVYEIKEPKPVDVNSGSNDEICNGEELMLSGSASGGTGSFTYKWSSSPSSSITESNTATPTVKPSQTTIYKLTVTDKTTNCVSTDEVEIKVNLAPIVQFDIPNQELCSGETTQVVNITSIPLGESITWSSAANDVSGASVSGTNQIPAQTLINTTGRPIDVVYTALISSSSQGNCAAFPTKYIIRVNPAPNYVNESIEICNDQSFNFKPQNLITESTFTWTVNAPVRIVGATNVTVAQSSISQTLQNTSDTPLEVIYTISPALGLCLGKPFELKVTVQPSQSILFSESDQSLCTGGTSKAVNFISPVSGAIFSWTAIYNGVTGGTPSGSGNQIPAQTLINPTNKPILVEYQVAVSISSGGSCAGIPKTYRITVNPTLVLNSENSDFKGFAISCAGENDGFIKLSTSGGGGDFKYNWTGSNSFISKQKDISGLAPGTYEVNISDDSGCTATKIFQILEPPILIANVISFQNILCKGDESGRIEIEVIGGVAPYSYQWKRNGAIITSDQKELLNIPAGNYEIVITDSRGCIQNLTINLTEPAAVVVINYTKTDISCYGANDGSLDLDVSGGLPPYTITWSFGSTQSGFDNLGPADYTLTVSDQSGCIRSQIITIEDAPLFKTDSEIKQISCFGKKDGFIKLNLQGGFGKTTVRWDNGAELESLFNLTAGFYGVTMKDETDCEIRSEFNIIEPALLQIEPNVTDALDCVNPQGGEIRLGISGGTPPYTIKWSNGQTSEDLTGITSGQYAVAITDASGCIINKAFEIKRPPVLSIIAFQSTNVQCEPRVIEDKIKITLSGGIVPYTISWSGGTISSDGRTMTTTEPGFYKVTVVDGKGCVTTQSFDIENKETIAESDIESAAFDQYNSYLVNFEIQFWNRSFGNILTYYWDFGDGSESFDENPKHIYQAEGEYEITLIVTDVFGCAVEVKKKITVFDYYLVVPNIFSPNGDGINDYFFPRFVGIESLEFWILNKWGENIYYTDDLNSQGWDGKIYKETPIPGNYVYKLRFKTLDGRTQTITDLFMLLK